LIRQKFDEMQVTIKFKQDGRLNDALNMVKTGHGLKMMNDIRMALRILKTEQDRLLVVRHNRLQQETADLEIRLLFLGSFAVLSLSFISFLAYKFQLRDEREQSLQSLLYVVSQKLVDAVEPDAALHLVAQTIQDFLRFDWVSTWTVDEKRSVLTC